MPPKVRAVRKHLKRASWRGTPAEAEQLAVLDDDATGRLWALNREGTAPFDFPAVPAGEDLEEVAPSLERLAEMRER